MKNKNYKVIVDEKCPEHGGDNFAYQYDDENFVRNESICEDCCRSQLPRQKRTPTLRESVRPQRPARQ